MKALFLVCFLSLSPEVVIARGEPLTVFQNISWGAIWDSEDSFFMNADTLANLGVVNGYFEESTKGNYTGEIIQYMTKKKFKAEAKLMATQGKTKFFLLTVEGINDGFILKKH